MWAYAHSCLVIRLRVSETARQVKQIGGGILFAQLLLLVELAELCRVSIDECDALCACVSLHLRMLVRYVCE
jgi:hypothetical protein